MKMMKRRRFKIDNIFRSIVFAVCVALQISSLLILIRRGRYIISLEVVFTEIY